MNDSMNNFRLGDPVIVRRDGVPVAGHVWGHTFASTHDPDWFDVKTATGVVTRLRAGDMQPDKAGKRMEATR